MQDSIPYIYLLPNDRGNSSGYGFPMRFEALILPELAAVLKVQGGTRAEGYQLIYDISKQNKLQASLSPSQEIELYQYLMQIGAKNDEYRNRGMLKKFTDYINGKLAERTNPPDWYSRLKKQL
jgi:hypothetical protein